MNLNPSLNFISPEMVLTLFAMLALFGSVSSRLKHSIGLLSFMGVAASAVFLPLSFRCGQFSFYGMLINDPFSVFFRSILIVASAFTILLSMGYSEREEENGGEFYFFILALTVSMMLAVSSSNLLMIYLAVEAVSLISYILAGYHKKNPFSSEAGVKYFLFGAFSTGVMLYGISLIYGLFGTLDLGVIFRGLTTASYVDPAAVLVAALLILVGIGFKSAVVPFHMWAPDVYQGAPTPVTALFSVGPKAVGFALLLRVFTFGFHSAFTHWGTLAGFLAILTMTVGNVLALRQSNIKRILAFSSIAHAGYLLAGVAVGTVAGAQAVMYYLFIYTLMNLAAFGAVIAIGNALHSETVEDYAGLYRQAPFTAVILTVALLSLAGIPPLAGFIAKFLLLSAAVESDLVTLAVAISLNSVIALYYYVRIVKYMFLHEPAKSTTMPTTTSLSLALVVLTIAIFILGVWPQPVLGWLSGLLRLS